MTNYGLIACDNEIPAAEANTAIFVSVPGTRVCTRLVSLPTLPQKNREQVIGYALEEQIASSLDEIQFIAGPTDKSGLTPVLWCLRTDYEQWLSKWAAQKPKAILPDYLYLPLEEDAWTLRQHGSFCLARTGQYTGFSIECSQLLAYLELSDNRPHYLICDGEALADQLANFVKEHNLVLIRKKLPQLTLPDDLSFSLLPKRPWYCKKFSNRWYLPLSLAALSVTCLSVGLFCYAMELKQARIHNREQLAALYQQADPGHALPNNPVEQLEQLKDQLQTNLHPDPVLQPLRIAGQLIDANPALRLESFNAQVQQLTLTLSSQTNKAFDTLLIQLRKQMPFFIIASNPSEMATSPMTTITITITQKAH